MSKENMGSQKRTERFDTYLKCKLLPDEIISFAKEMAETNTTINELEGDLKAVQAEFKGKIAGKEARRATLSQLVASGQEHRMVKCERVFDYEKALVTESRTDDQEPKIILTRKMTEQELQLEIDLQTN